tara:strand:- start:289 stop:555 length:267 start_codon:yes stop_codon:yes gene_type:complete
VKILDDVTNEIIEDKVAVKITFHPYDLDRHCLTIEGKEEPNNFQAKTLFVSKTTASTILADCDDPNVFKELKKQTDTIELLKKVNHES